MACVSKAGFPPWVFCNACASEPEGDPSGLRITNCRHMFCEQCIPKDKCPVCNKPIMGISSLGDKVQKSASRIFFQDPLRLLEILEFQMTQMTVALKNAKKFKQVSRNTEETGDDTIEILQREIAVLKEENRYWKGLFNSTYIADTPKSTAGKIFTPSSSSARELHSLAFSSSSTENSPVKQKRLSTTKDTRKVVLLTKELEVLKDEKAALSEEIKQLKATIEEAVCRERVLYQQVATGNSEMKTLNCELQAYQSKCNVMEEENGILKALMNDGKEQLAKANAEITRLQQATEVSGKTAQVMKQEIDEKNNELNQLTNVIESLSAKLQEGKDAQQEAEQLALQLEQKNAEIKLLESKQELLTTPTSHLRRKISSEGKPHCHGSSSALPLTTGVFETPKQQSMIPSVYRNVRRTPWKKPVE